jgi:hypothetical protein
LLSARYKSYHFMGTSVVLLLLSTASGELAFWYQAIFKTETIFLNLEIRGGSLLTVCCKTGVIISCSGGTECGTSTSPQR